MKHIWNFFKAVIFLILTLAVSGFGLKVLSYPFMFGWSLLP